MAWIDSYRQASFRGVPFFVEAHDAEFGRRQVTHEFPQRDTPYTEDLGRRARTYSVEAYLIGDDYPAQRDQLIQAAETGEAGDLVHPYLGDIRVVCTGLRLRETNTELRMCRAQITFIEAGESRYPSEQKDPEQIVGAAATTASQAAEDAVPERFTVAGFASFVQDAARDGLQAFTELVQGLPIGVGGDSQGIAAFFEDLASIASEATSLVTEPAAMAARVRASLGSVRAVFGGGAGSALAAIQAAYARPATSTAPLATPSRTQERENDLALAGLVRRTCIAEAARFAVAQAQPPAPGQTVDAFETREEAIAARDTLTAAIDTELEDPRCSEEEYSAMAGLRAEIVASIPPRDLVLPRIAEITPPATTPSLVLAYSLYADANRAQEIAERNRIPHPGFIPGREPIRVVTDA